MKEEQYYKNYSMCTELDIAGEFIYDGISAINQAHTIKDTSMVFSFLYHTAVGIERLQKIILVLMEKIDFNNEEQTKNFEKSLITHSHQDLNTRICNNTDLKLTSRENYFLQLLTNFYKDFRYNRFNIKLNFENEQKLIFDFIEKIAKKPLTYNMIDDTILMISEDIKELFGRTIGSISQKYYSLIKDLCFESNIYSYEIRSNSKAEKVFYLNNKKNSLQSKKIDEKLSLKELIVFVRNAKQSRLLLKYIDNIEPLDFDVALINDYIEELSNGIIPQALIDEVETLYEEFGYGKDRIEDIDAIGNSYVQFD